MTHGPHAGAGLRADRAGRDRPLRPYGGRFVPEALVAALDELDAAYDAAQADPAFVAELDRAAAHVHRPAEPAHRRAPGSSAHAGGARILLKREDLNHTGSHKINNVLGQALLTERMGKTRVIAETGAGQHGVATATAAALFGLECVVYMGEEDTRRQALNVARMRLLGAEVVPVDDRAAHPQGRDQRGACATGSPTSSTTHYLLGTVAGPHPFPEMVRDFHRVIGDEARAAGARPDRPAAGRRRRLRRRRLQRDRHLPRASSTTPRCALYGFEAGGDGRRDRPARRHASPAARRACCTARARTCCRTTTARPIESHSISRRARLPGRRARARLAARHRPGARTAPVTDAEAMEAFALLCRTEGIIPAIESAHALAGALDASAASSGPDAVDRWSTCPAAATRTWTPRPRWFGLLDEASAPRGRGEPAARAPSPTSARPRAGPRSIGYLPAGFPSVDGAIEALRAMVEAGVDVVEVGPALLRPADGRSDHPARRRERAGAAAPAPTTSCATVEAVAAHRRPDARHDLLEPGRALRRRRASPRDLAAAGGVGADHARPDPGRGRADWIAATRRARPRPGLPGRALARPPSGIAVDRCGTPRLRLRRLDAWASPGRGPASAAGAERLVSRTRAATDLPRLRRARACPRRPRPPRWPATPTA